MPRKEIYWKTREKCLEQNKKYYNNNKQQERIRNTNYLRTDYGKKISRLNAWKQAGLICDNIEELYEHYINTWECDNCGVELVSGNYGANRRCLDHCHITGKFRNILCHTCNIQRGLDDRSNLIVS
jgi:hypothetical protein